MTNSNKDDLKILITGASGFIGSRMLGRLLASSSANNYQIIWMTLNADNGRSFLW